MKNFREGVTICGACGLGNTGDEAILAAMVRQLRQDDPSRTITVIASGRYPLTVKGVQIISRKAIFRCLRQLEKTELFLSGGGSLLQDVTSRRSLAYYLFTIEAAHRRGAKVMLYGCGIGPLTRKDSRERVADVLNRCADSITLRDTDSLKLLLSIGVRGDLLHQAADPVLEGAELAEKQQPGAQLLGICLRPWPGLEEQLPALEQTVREICREHLLRPVFLCLGEGDEQAVRSLREKVGGELTRDETILPRCALMLSMRLHGLIFAVRAGVPAAGISYDPKVDGFCKDADLPCVPLNGVQSDNLACAARTAFSVTPEELDGTARRLSALARVNVREAERLLSAPGT